MDTPQEMEKPQSGSLPARPASPVMTVAISLAVLVLLLSIFLPFGPSRKALELALRGNLHQIRFAIK